MKFDFTIKKSLPLVFSVLLSFVTGIAIVKPEVFIVYGYLGLFIFAISGGQGVYILPFIIENFSVIAFILIVSFGMAINDSLGYLVGKTSREIIILNSFDKKLKSIVDKFGFIGIIALSAIPFPISNGLIGGFLKIKYLRFFVGTLLGKMFLMILVYLILLFR